MEQFLPVIRGFLLVTAVSQLLMASVLFGVLRRRWLQPMRRKAVERGQSGGAIWNSDAIWRLAMATMTVVPLALWWYLGTPTAVASLAHVVSTDRVATPSEEPGAVSTDTLRVRVANVIPVLTVLAFLAYSLYCVRLDWRIGRYRTGVGTPGSDVLDPASYQPEARPLLARLRRLRRYQTLIWLGFICAGNVLYCLVKP